MPRPTRVPDPPPPEVLEDIPIRALETVPEPLPRGAAFIEPPPEQLEELAKIHAAPKRELPPLKPRFVFRLPSTDLLQEAVGTHRL